MAAARAYGKALREYFITRQALKREKDRTAEPNYVTHPELFPDAEMFSPPGLMPDEARRRADAWLEHLDRNWHISITYTTGWHAALAFIPKDECVAVWVPKKRALDEKITARRLQRARAMGLLRQRWPDRSRARRRSH